MKTLKHIISGIDIGTTKIAVIIAEYNGKVVKILKTFVRFEQNWNEEPS